MGKLIIRCIEFLKYSIGGAIATVVNLALFVLFEKIGIYYIAANGIAYFIAVILNYMLNSTFVFRGMQKSTMKDTVANFTKFLLIKFIYLLIDSILFYLMVSVLKYNVYLSRIIITSIGLVVTYYYTKKYVYNEGSGKNEEIS